MAEWQQVSGDSNASEYGATFAQVDSYQNSMGRVYGVNIVEILNGYEACGRDWTGDAYLTESSYVDVDGMEWQQARDIMASCGGTSYAGDDCAMPYSAAKRLVYTRQRNRDMRRLIQWERRELTDSESKELAALASECETLREWFSIPRVQRAEMAHSYGGYGDGQSPTFATLREAMEYHGIPRSALWNPSEYDAPAPEQEWVDDITDE